MLTIFKKAVLLGKKSDQPLRALLVAGLSAGALGGALLFQYAGGLQPCVLCVYQRWPHLVIVMLAGAVAFLHWNAGHRRTPDHMVAVFFALAGVAALTGAGLAAYHVGVEQSWWTGSAGCSAPLEADSIDELRDRLLAAPMVRCDEVAWSFLGLSMAAYNGILSLFLLFLCIRGACISAAQGSNSESQ